jgi:hypothetical protein
VEELVTLYLLYYYPCLIYDILWIVKYEKFIFPTSGTLWRTWSIIRMKISWKDKLWKARRCGFCFIVSRILCLVIFCHLFNLLFPHLLLYYSRMKNVYKFDTHIDVFNCSYHDCFSIIWWFLLWVCNNIFKICFDLRPSGTKFLSLDSYFRSHSQVQIGYLRYFPTPF